MTSSDKLDSNNTKKAYLTVQLMNKYSTKSRSTLMKVTKNATVNQPQNFYTEVTMHSYEFIS